MSDGATEWVTPDFYIDVRTKAADASTSLLDKTAAKQFIRTDGKASITWQLWQKLQIAHPRTCSICLI